MTIKAFVFDCGGVLLRDGDISAYQEWEAELGLKPGDLRERLWEGEPWTSAECGKLTDAQFWAQIGEHFGLSDAEQIATLREQFWNTWVIDEQVLALVERVREKYRVAMLSNSTDALKDLLENRYHVADRFEIIVNSALLGTAKPDQAIYKEMLRQLDLKANEVVFIDDRAENIAAAAAMGIHVIWFVHADELERQLAIYLGSEAQAPQGVVVSAEDVDKSPEQNIGT